MFVKYYKMLQNIYAKFLTYPRVLISYIIILLE